MRAADAAVQRPLPRYRRDVASSQSAQRAADRVWVAVNRSCLHGLLARLAADVDQHVRLSVAANRSCSEGLLEPDNQQPHTTTHHPNPNSSQPRRCRFSPMWPILCTAASWNRQHPSRQSTRHAARRCRRPACGACSPLGTEDAAAASSSPADELAAPASLHQRRSAADALFGQRPNAWSRHLFCRTPTKDTSGPRSPSSASARASR